MLAVTILAVTMLAVMILAVTIFPSDNCLHIRVIDMAIKVRDVEGEDAAIRPSPFGALGPVAFGSPGAEARTKISWEKKIWTLGKYTHQKRSLLADQDC